MTRLDNELCSIEIELDEKELDDTFWSDDEFYSDYDIILDPDGYLHKDCRIAYDIRIKMPGREYSVALVGHICCEDDDCAVLEGEILTILHCFDVVQFNVMTSQIVKTAPVDDYPNFSIYRVRDGYLVHGELRITMLNDDLDKVWSFGGRDIFVSPDGGKAFRIGEDRIYLYDFENNYYEIDFQGREIKAVMHDSK